MAPLALLLGAPLRLLQRGAGALRRNQRVGRRGPESADRRERRDDPRVDELHVGDALVAEGPGVLIEVADVRDERLATGSEDARDLGDRRGSIGPGVEIVD